MSTLINNCSSYRHLHETINEKKHFLCYCAFCCVSIAISAAMSISTNFSFVESYEYIILIANWMNYLLNGLMAFDIIFLIMSAIHAALLSKQLEASQSVRFMNEKKR